MADPSDFRLPPGGKLLDAIRAGALSLPLPCGGTGRCGACRCHVDGDAVPPDAAERERLGEAALAAGLRLACRVRAGAGGLRVRRLRSPSRPWVTGFDGEDVPPGTALGVALDLGTTSLWGRLVALHSGRVLAEGRLDNPQAIFGADVISRLGHALGDGEVARRLREDLRGAAGSLVTALCASRHRSCVEVSRLVAVANPPVHHLLLGLPVEGLARFPFTPSAVAARTEDPAPSWLGCVGARLFLPPLVGGFVGSDALALAWGLGAPEAPRLVMDLGTNGEILLQTSEGSFGASAAMGPAFEGAGLRHGMSAAPGGIVGVELVLGEARCRCIEEARPVGLCGAGWVSLMAELRRRELVDGEGVLVSPSSAPPLWRDLLVPGDSGEGAFRLCEGARGPIEVDRGEIRAFQLAKGALSAAASMLLRRAGLAWEDLGEVVLAGAFAQALAVEDLVTLGMLPAALKGRCRFVGNGALHGAALLLAEESPGEATERLARSFELVRLEGEEDFPELFLRAMTLGAGAFA